MPVVQTGYQCPTQAFSLDRHLYGQPICRPGVRLQCFQSLPALKSHKAGPRRTPPKIFTDRKSREITNMRFVLAYAAAHAHPHCSLSVAFRPVCPRPPNTFLHWLHVGLDISLLSMSGRLPVALARRSLWFREMRGLPDAVFPLPSCRPVPRVGTSCSHGTARQSRKACGNLQDLGRRCCNFPAL